MADDCAKRVTTLFAYGTLMRGRRNHARFCGDALSIEPASTTGRLYDLPDGFPAMVGAADGVVHGEAMTFPDLKATLASVDVLEGYRPDPPGRSLYLRRVQPVTLLGSGTTVPAYCYLWHGPLPPEAAFLPSGRWQA